MPPGVPAATADAHCRLATLRRSSVAAAAIPLIVGRTKAANCVQKRGANGRSNAAQPVGDGYSGLPLSVPIATADTHCSQPPSRSSVAAAAIPTIVERTKAANCMQKRGANGRSNAAQPVGDGYWNLPPSVPTATVNPHCSHPRQVECRRRRHSDDCGSYESR